MTIELGSYVEFLSTLSGEYAGSGIVHSQDPISKEYGVCGAWWDGELFFPEDELRVVSSPSSADLWSKLGPWEPSVRRGSQHDGWNGCDERWERGMGRVIARLV